MAIADLSERGIINGYANGGFGLDDPVTRQQLAKKKPRNVAEVQRLVDSIVRADVAKLRSSHSNPCHGVEHNKEAKRKRYLMNEELGRLGVVLEKWEPVSPSCGPGIRSG